jgi:IS5 family transposase
MLAKPKSDNQLSFFTDLLSQISHSHTLFKLANIINWQVFEDSFSKHYSKTMGKPAKPIRLMVSLLILKQLRNLSDENVVLVWSENLYFQYFSGEKYFVPSEPCSSTELVEFRKRIGEQGAELIFKESIKVNGKDGEGDVLSADTTVHEKNITYPVDTKLHQKIIKKCLGISKKENLTLRQTYTFTLKKLGILLRFQHTKLGSKQARKARQKVKTIAGRLVRELNRKLDTERLLVYSSQLMIYEKIILQKRGDSNKIYSLHEPDVKCYTKGKQHKKFEFGSKASILVTQATGVIVGAVSFNEQIHDSKTLPKAIEQYERILEKSPKEIIADRGYRGPKKINQTIIYTPKPDKNITPELRKKHSRRAAIEPVIGHLKSDYRLNKNFLKGVIGDAINLLLSAAAMNFKRVMNLCMKEATTVYNYVIRCILEIIMQSAKLCPKLTF